MRCAVTLAVHAQYLALQWFQSSDHAPEAPLQTSRGAGVLLVNGSEARLGLC